MALDFQPATSVAYSTNAGHQAGPNWMLKVGPNQVITLNPGSPWQNGHIESFNSRLRDEFLNGHLFESLLEAQVLLEDWRHEYNHERLHSSLCYMTPVEFKELWE
jgi:putative transposase